MPPRAAATGRRRVPRPFVAARLADGAMFQSAGAISNNARRYGHWTDGRAHQAPIHARPRPGQKRDFGTARPRAHWSIWPFPAESSRYLDVASPIWDWQLQTLA